MRIPPLRNNPESDSSRRSLKAKALSENGVVGHSKDRETLAGGDLMPAHPNFEEFDQWLNYRSKSKKRAAVLLEDRDEMKEKDEDSSNTPVRRRPEQNTGTFSNSVSGYKGEGVAAMEKRLAGAALPVIKQAANLMQRKTSKRRMNRTIESQNSRNANTVRKVTANNSINLTPIRGTRFGAFIERS